MGCDELKPPELPKLDPSQLPEGVSFPDGMSPDAFAAQADSNSMLSDAVKGAENLIDKNVKNLGETLNPEAIGNKIGSAIGGIAGQITGAVEQAAAGISGIGDSIANIGNQKPELSPDSIIGKVKSPGPGLDVAALAAKKKCDEEYLNKAAKLKADMQAKADAKIAALSPQDRKLMNESPAKREQIMKNIEAEVADEQAQEAIDSAKKVEKEDRTVQDNLQSNDVTSIKRGSKSGEIQYREDMFWQMVALHTRMNTYMRYTVNSFQTILVDMLLPNRESPNEPSSTDKVVQSLYELVIHVANYRALRSLATHLVQVEWPENCPDYFPAQDADFEDVNRNFDKYLQSKAYTLYGDDKKIISRTVKPITGKENREEFWKLWDESAWIMDKNNNTDGVFQELIDQGVATNSPGALGVDMEILNNVVASMPQLSIILTNMGADASSVSREYLDGADETLELIQNGDFIGVLALLLSGSFRASVDNETIPYWGTRCVGTVDCYPYRNTVPADLQTFVYEVAQPQVIEKFNLESDPGGGKIVYGVSTPRVDDANRNRVYEKNFLLETVIDWSTLKVGVSTYLNEEGDERTRKAVQNY